MRLSQDQIKQGLLHPDKEVRNTCLRYFTHSYSHDPTVLPLIIQMIDQHGWEQAFSYYHFLDRLEPTEETVTWAIRELERDLEEKPPRKDHEPLLKVLVKSPVELLTRYRQELEKVAAQSPTHQKRIQRRMELVHADADAVWQKLEEFCEENKSVEYVGDADIEYAEDLIEVLVRSGVKEDRILGILSQEIEDYQDNPLFWMEGFMVDLAGKLRMKSAIPFILQKLLTDEEIDWLGPICEEALIRIGTDAVVSAIADCYSEANEFSRWSFASILESIHSEASLKTLFDLLALEEDVETRAMLGAALLLQFDSETIEPGYELIKSYKRNREVNYLRSDLLAVSALLEIEIPERAEWTRDLAAQRKRLDELLSAEWDDELSDEDDLDFWDDEEDWGEEDYEDDSLLYDTQPIHRVDKGSKVGRNEPCPCGSGKKFKKCCLHKKEQQELDTF